MSELNKLKELLEQAVFVCWNRSGDVDTEDGSFATIDTDSMIRLETAICEYFDLPSDSLELSHFDIIKATLEKGE